MQKFIHQWQDVEFDSSTTLTPQFAAFARGFKKSLSGAVKNQFEMVTFHRNHFELSGFLRNRTTQQMIFWSISDVRFFPNHWMNHVLVRTAASDTDFSGGPNHFTPLTSFNDMAWQLTT